MHYFSPSYSMVNTGYFFIFFFFTTCQLCGADGFIHQKEREEGGRKTHTHARKTRMTMYVYNTGLNIYMVTQRKRQTKKERENIVNSLSLLEGCVSTHIEYVSNDRWFVVYGCLSSAKVILNQLFPNVYSIGFERNN